MRTGFVSFVVLVGFYAVTDCGEGLWACGRCFVLRLRLQILYFCCQSDSLSCPTSWASSMPESSPDDWSSKKSAAGTGWSARTYWHKVCMIALVTGTMGLSFLLVGPHTVQPSGVFSATGSPVDPILYSDANINSLLRVPKIMPIWPPPTSSGISRSLK